MTVTMSLEISGLIPMNSNFFKVMNASGGVIGTWDFNYILDVLVRFLRTSDGLYDNQRPQTKCWDMFGRWKPVQRAVIAGVYERYLFTMPLNTELGKSWSFGHCHAIDRYHGPCMIRLSVL